jgi:hypothetical protein
LRSYNEPDIVENTQNKKRLKGEDEGGREKEPRKEGGREEKTHTSFICS